MLLLIMLEPYENLIMLVQCFNKKNTLHAEACRVFLFYSYFFLVFPLLQTVHFSILVPILNTLMYWPYILSWNSCWILFDSQIGQRLTEQAISYYIFTIIK